MVRASENKILLKSTNIYGCHKIGISYPHSTANTVCADDSTLALWKFFKIAEPKNCFCFGVYMRSTTVICNSWVILTCRLHKLTTIGYKIEICVHFMLIYFCDGIHMHSTIVIANLLSQHIYMFGRTVFLKKKNHPLFCEFFAPSPPKELNTTHSSST